MTDEDSVVSFVGKPWSDVLKTTTQTESTEFNEDDNVQKVSIRKDAFYIKTPFRMALSGPSCAGKSTYLLRMLEQHERFFDKKFDHYVYCFPEDALYHSRRSYIEKLGQVVPNLKVVEGYPDVLSIGKMPGSKFIFFDDM